MTTQNTQLSGEEVGRLVLKDLATVYLNSRQGREAVGLLSPEDKADLVNNLVDPADVVAYNQYRYVHEYLSRAAVMFLLNEASAEAIFWRLTGLFDAMKLAELENSHFLLAQPRLMTRKQYEETPGLFSREEGDYGFGLAILEPKLFDKNTLDKKGHYHPPLPQWRLPFMAESILANNRGDVLQGLADYRTALRECLVIKTAVDLMGKLVGVPEVSSLVGEVNFEQTSLLNEQMRQLPSIIHRQGVFPGERIEDELRDELAEILVPIDVKDLKPTPAALRKARRAVDFSIAQGQSEKLYAILRERE